VSDDNDDQHNRPVPGPPPRAESGILSSDELLAGRREVLISHQGEFYRLRVTRQGKLILHK
jgi:hemin uptake protein HemP